MKKPLTKEQITYNADRLIKRKKKVVYLSKKEMPAALEETPRTQYMRNCIYWIEEYYAGRVTVDRFHTAINYLYHHIAQLKMVKEDEK